MTDSERMKNGATKSKVREDMRYTIRQAQEAIKVIMDTAVEHDETMAYIIAQHLRKAQRELDRAQQGVLMYIDEEGGPVW